MAMDESKKRKHNVMVRLNDAGLAWVDEARGDRSRADYFRDLAIRDHDLQKGSPAQRERARLQQQPGERRLGRQEP